MQDIRKLIEEGKLFELDFGSDNILNIAWRSVANLFGDSDTETMVEEILNGNKYGVGIRNASKDHFENYQYRNDAGQNATGVLGYWRGEGAKKTAYIPGYQDIEKMLPGIDPQGARDYIKVHEIVEAVKDATHYHADFESEILGAMKSLGEKGNKKAEAAYKAALEIHEQRDNNDPFGNGVKERYLVADELTNLYRRLVA